MRPEERVQVDADQLDIRTQGRRSRHGPHDETEPAPHVDDPHGARATSPDHLDDWRQSRSDTPGQLELLAEPLQLAMHAKAEGIHITQVQNPIRSRNRRHDPPTAWAP